MTCISSALVVGGSIGGMAAAIALARAGVRVDVIEISTEALGASIGFSGRAANALVDLGVYDEIRATSHVWDAKSSAMAQAVRNTAGELIHPGPTRPTWPGAVAAVGVYRPVFVDVMGEIARGLGVSVRKGVTWKTIDDSGDGVTVGFSDDEVGTYDLLVAADGIYSKIRTTFFPEAKRPEFTGQLSIRWMAPGPSIEPNGQYTSPKGRLLFYYLPHGSIYVATQTTMKELKWLSDDDVRSIFTAVTDSFTAPAVRELASRLSPDAKLIGRPFEWHLVDDPWFRGRILLLGDAAHATSAHMGAGGGMALEDAVVLGESLKDNGTLESALKAFMKRRFERVKFVVETSATLSKMEQQGVPPSANQELLTKAFAAIAEPY